MSYAGVFRSQVPLIVRLHRQGKSAPEIVAEVTPAPRPWLRSYERRPISVQLVKYILFRLGEIEGPVRRLSPRQNVFVTDFERRSEKWRQASRLSQVVWLYEVLGWIAGEIEARRKAGGSDVEGR